LLFSSAGQRYCDAVIARRDSTGLHVNFCDGPADQPFPAGFEDKIARAGSTPAAKNPRLARDTSRIYSRLARLAWRRQSRELVPIGRRSANPCLTKASKTSSDTTRVKVRA
jgi:hypothetical protein